MVLILLCNVALAQSDPDLAEKVRKDLVDGSTSFLGACSDFFVAYVRAETLDFSGALGGLRSAVEAAKSVEICDEVKQLLMNTDYDLLRNMAEADGIAVDKVVWEQIVAPAKKGDPITPISFFTSLMRSLRDAISGLISDIEAEKPEEILAKQLWKCTSIFDKTLHTGNYVAYINLETTKDVERIKTTKAGSD